MEMRACKECGKLFMPKGREKYCSEIHYRPCPTCGTPVIAKYLSDPARKCNDCKHKKIPVIQNQSKSLFNLPEHADNKQKEDQKLVIPEILLNLKVEPTIETSVYCETVSGTVRRYVGPTLKNSFIQNHDYLLKIEHDEYTYGVSASEDLTIKEDVDIFRNYSSQISINQQFVEVA